MKVLQINKYHYMRGGSERVFFNTIKLLRDHGHQVAPFATAHPKSLPSDFDKYFVDAPEIRDMGMIDRIKALPRFFWSNKAARALDELLQDFKPDIAHIHNFFNGLSLSILPVLRRHGVPVVMTLHDPRLVCPSPQWMLFGNKCLNCRKTLYTNCLRNRCCEGSLVLSAMGTMEMIHKDFLTRYDRCVDRYIFLNQAYRRLMSREHPEMMEKGVVLPNFSPDLTMHQTERGDYFLFYGRLTEGKGVATFIKAAREVPEARFVVAGEGEMEKDLRDAALPNVEMRGFLSGQALADTISGAQAILVPSEWMDNNPMTIIEAYSYGKPVIASDIGGIPDMIIEGRTGHIVSPKAPDELAAAIRRIGALGDADYAAMSSEARRFALDNFNSDVYYSRLMEIYRQARSNY